MDIDLTAHLNNVVVQREKRAMKERKRDDAKELRANERAARRMIRRARKDFYRCLSIPYWKRPFLADAFTSWRTGRGPKGWSSRTGMYFRFSGHSFFTEFDGRWPSYLLINAVNEWEHFSPRRFLETQPKELISV